MKTYRITYYDCDSGAVHERLVNAASAAKAIELIERAGEYEVIECVYEGRDI